MATWNDIPYDEDAEPAIKGLEFDLQVEENGGDSHPPVPYAADIVWPKETDNFGNDK